MGEVETVAVANASPTASALEKDIFVVFFHRLIDFCVQSYYFFYFISYLCSKILRYEAIKVGFHRLW